MNNYLKGIVILLLFIGLCRCDNPDVNANKEELITIDKAFSKLSEEQGMQHAFLKYASEDVVMLRENNYPLVGKNALCRSYQSFSDTGFVLTWEPLFADIAHSGDLGYTYGVFTMMVDDSSGEKSESKGTYVSIWKKNEKRNWKFVLDSGNEGLSEQH